MKFFVLGTTATVAVAAAWLPSSFPVYTTRRDLCGSSRLQKTLLSRTAPARRCLHLQTSSCHRLSIGGKRPLAAQSSDDDDNAQQPQPGMEKAFRELEALQSLDDDDDDDNNPSSLPVKGFDTATTSLVDAITTTPASEVTPEKEVQMYQDMVKELENKNEDDLYSDVLADMGGTTAASSQSRSAAKSPLSSILGKNDRDDVSQRDRDDFMNQALEEALQDVQLNNPSISKSILDDQEMMKEIEAIFERGNEKLLASLEEIRDEQVSALEEMIDIFTVQRLIWKMGEINTKFRLLVFLTLCPFCLGFFRLFISSVNWPKSVPHRMPNRLWTPCKKMRHAYQWRKHP